MLVHTGIEGNRDIRRRDRPARKPASTESDMEASPPAKPVIVVQGDCQSMSLVGGMRRAPELADRFEIHWLRRLPDGEAPAATSPIPPEAWKRCIAYCTQVGDVGPPPHYIAELPDTVPKITFLRLFVNPTFPFLQHDRLMRPPGQPARWSDGDQFIYRLSEQDVPPTEVYDRYEAMVEEAVPAVDRTLEANARLMVERDRGTDVPIAGYVFANLAGRRLFWGPGHPTAELMAEQLDRLLGAVLPGETRRGGKLFGVAARVFKSYDPLAGIQAPIPRAVADRLDLRWWSPEYQYRFDPLKRRLTLRQFVVDYIAARREKLAAAARETPVAVAS
jgi:hypothetical protein